MALDRASVAAALAVLVLLLPVKATAQPKIDNKPMFAEAIDPGGTIVVTGSGFATPISGDLYNAAGQKTTLDPPALSDDKTITFRLPRDIQVGRYAMKISVGNVTDIVVPGELRVRQPEIKLDAAHPTTAYRDGTGGFSFALIGQNFPALASDLAVDIEGEGAIVAPTSPGANAKKTPDEEMKSCTSDAAPLPCLWVEDHGHRIQVRGLKPGKFEGPVMVRVRAGGSSQSDVVSNT